MTVTANQRKKITQDSVPAVWGGACFLFAGWAMVLYEPLIFPAFLHSGAGSFLPKPGYHLPIIGQSAIITGIGLTLVSLAIQLMRLLIKLGTIGTASAQPTIQAVQTAERQTPTQITAENCKNRVIPPVQKRAARNPAREVITRGALNGRGYVLFRDGSVVVETLLGPKRFESMTDAQDYIAAKLAYPSTRQ